MVDGDVLVVAQMIDDAGAVVLPEIVVVAVLHRLDEPGFVVGRELERRRARPQRQIPHVLINVAPEIHERGNCSRIRRCARGGRRRVPGSRRITQREYPVEESQLEGAVVPDAVPAEVRHRIDRNHRLEVGRVRDGQRMLRRPGIGRSHGAEVAVEPWLTADPRCRVGSVVRVVGDRPPVPLGLVSRAHVLADHDVAARHEVGGRRRHAILVVGRALHDRRESAVGRRAVSRGAVDVGGQLDAVAHRNHDVAHDGGAERQAGCGLILRPRGGRGERKHCGQNDAEAAIELRGTTHGVLLVRGLRCRF